MSRGRVLGGVAVARGACVVGVPIPPVGLGTLPSTVSSSSVANVLDEIKGYHSVLG